ncbi:AAA family ATPase [Lacipirellula sp.]|uniref:AAA family ATPase n=1 Tax=Lacipirellula sp. TaxID=2691419 RepID=UPI003D0B6165
MASGEQVKALLQSYAEGDSRHFLSVATQIAAAAARQGKGNLAKEIRDIVEEVKRKVAEGQIGSVPIARPVGELAGLLIASYPKTHLAELVLADPTKAQLVRVVEEYRQLDRLRSHALSPARKLLLVGPPGCGKSMTASALAGELKLPLLAVQLHSLITKFMGETAAKLHAVFQAMRSTRGVYLFDEFDAIGSDRAAKNDVGEIRRVLNSFLQFLEHDDSDSLVIAATNHINLLDTALFRRFDHVIVYHLPSPNEVRTLIENRLHRFGVSELDWNEIEIAAVGLSHAEIGKACDDSAKDAVLDGADFVSSSALVESIRRRQGPPRER